MKAQLRVVHLHPVYWSIPTLDYVWGPLSRGQRMKSAIVAIRNPSDASLVRTAPPAHQILTQKQFAIPTIVAKLGFRRLANRFMRLQLTTCSKFSR